MLVKDLNFFEQIVLLIMRNIPNHFDTSKEIQDFSDFFKFLNFNENFLNFSSKKLILIKTLRLMVFTQLD